MMERYRRQYSNQSSRIINLAQLHRSRVDRGEPSCHNTVLVQLVMLSFRFSQNPHRVHASDIEGIFFIPSGIIEYVGVPVSSLLFGNI